jgi:hypothetical protein
VEKEINIPEKKHIKDKYIVCFAFLFLVIGSASAEENWWQFRGPRGDGHTTSTNLPLKWSEEGFGGGKFGLPLPQLTGGNCSRSV